MEDDSCSGYFFLIMVIVYLIYLGFFKHEETKPTPSYYPTYSQHKTSIFESEDEPISEPENPYSPGSGHSAGYDWAERTGGDCSGNSNSFNEGCEEYYSQAEEE
jgi:hypothetical protein